MTASTLEQRYDRRQRGALTFAEQPDIDFSRWWSFEPQPDALDILEAYASAFSCAAAFRNDV